MGLRFRKSISILPGIRLNVSGSGTSLSLGPRGASVNVGKRGVYGNVGIPGTGLSWRERLDKPSPAPRQRASTPPPTPRPEMPSEVTGTMVGDHVQFCDGQGVPLRPELIPAAKAALKDQLQPFLEAHATQRNEPAEQLRRLHWDVPSTVQAQQTTSRGKPVRESFPDQTAYMQALMTWRADQANAGPDISAVEDALLQALEALAWPAETNIAVSLNGTRLLLDVDLPEIEAMPNTRWVPAPTRFCLEQKTMAQKDVASLYLDHVCSIVTRLLGHCFAASSAIQTVGISAYTQRSSALGQAADEYVITCEADRTQWSQVYLANMSQVDPHNLVRWLGAKIATNSRGLLLAQSPLV